MSRKSFTLIFVIFSCLSLLWQCTPAYAEQYTAFSLKVAEEKIKQLGDDWRTKEPDIFNLGRINKVEGFVYDEKNQDLILVGTHEDGRAEITLDDLVVALRTRFRYGEWPLVSIDPTPDTPKTQMQFVRFEGGIQNTAFGQSLFDADYRLKQMGMGLEQPGITGFLTYWDRRVKEAESAIYDVNSQFLFNPMPPHVAVREGVCVVRGLMVGVSSKVLSAKINGKPIEDIKLFKDDIADAFANDVSARFEELCRTQPLFNRLMGLIELVALSDALKKLEERPNINWWIIEYPLLVIDTPKETKVLKRIYDSKRPGFEISGKLELTAMALRLNAGDVNALRDAVLLVRPQPNALIWEFVAADWIIPIGEGQVKPEDIAPLFQQAYFLGEQERWSDALTLYEQVLKLDPNLAEAWSNKGAALGNLGRYEEAIRCFDRANEINPNYAEAWSNKGAALEKIGRYEEAIRCFDRAIEINPNLAEAWTGKGGALGNLGRYDESISCCDRAIEINPNLATAWRNKGAALGSLGRYKEEIRCCDRAIEINPNYAEAWSNKGTALGSLGRDDEAIGCFDRAIEIKPNLAGAWYNKGVALGSLGRYEEAIRCYDRAIEIKPNYAGAWYNKGAALYCLKRYSEARKAFEKAVSLGYEPARKALELLNRKGH